MKTNNGGPAFPNAYAGDQFFASGMTLRDYFAAAALQGFLADGSQRFVMEEIKDEVSAGGTIRRPMTLEQLVDAVNEQLTRNSYKLADAMLKARDEDGKN